MLQNTIVNMVASIILLLLLAHALLSMVGAKKVIPNMLRGLVTGLVNGAVWLIGQGAHLVGRGIGTFFRELGRAIVHAFRQNNAAPPPRP